MTEPFPPLNGAVPKTEGGSIARRRRKSSGLGADLPGDVDVPSFATSTRLDGMAKNSPVGVDMVWQLGRVQVILNYLNCAY